MSSSELHGPTENMGRSTGILLPGLLSLAIVAILFHLPQAAFHVNQPFKVELFLSLFLMIFFVLMRRRERTRRFSWENDKHVITIAGAIGGFVLWSAASFMWGASFGSVAHHTLLWSIYLTFFLIFTSGIWPDANFRFITTTFVIVSLILGVLCVFDYLTVSDFTSSEGDIRIRYGKYAETLVTISPMLWAAAIYTRNRRRRVFIFIAALLSWITVMLSLSKGAFIAGIIGFAIFFIASALFSAKSFRRRILVSAALWLAVTIGIQVFYSFFSAVPSTTSYITGAADPTRSTSSMRLFTLNVARQMAADHWLVGVGADNFGQAFNQARINYREKHPDDPREEIAEDYLVERAHNEPLQVLSELGVVGLLLFSLPWLLFALYFFRNFLFGRRRISPIFFAALAGMSAFFVSSQFSSFSFRSAQNGVAFFMVFAVAVNELRKPRPRTRDRAGRTAFATAVYLLGWLVTMLMTAFCVSKAYAEYQMYTAEHSKAYAQAQDHFRKAVAVDPEYAGAYLSNAARASADKNAVTAAEMTRKAIDHGLGVTHVYSKLAKQQIAAGNVAGAEATYREALAIYPRSLFIRTEFIVFLEDQGRSEAAAEQASTARSIDLRHANGWYLIIREGSVAAFYQSQTDPNVAPPVELTPYNGVRQYLDKVPGMEPVEPDDNKKF